MSESATRVLPDGRLMIVAITPDVRRLTRVVRAIREEAARKKAAA